MGKASIYREKLQDERTGDVRAGQTWFLQVTHNGKCYTRSARTLDKSRALAALRLLQAEVYEAEHDRQAAARIARTAEVRLADGKRGWRGRGIALARDALQHGARLGARAAVGVRALARLSHRLKRYRPETAGSGEREATPGWEGYCLSEEEEARLLAAAPPFLQDLMVFLLGTGAEPVEAVMLTWGAVDLDAAVVHFDAGNAGSGRIVPLPNHVCDLLTRLRLKAADLDRVFLASRPVGGRMPLEDPEPAFRVARRKANLKHLALRDLRYTYAVRLIASGVEPEDASKILGAPLRV